MNYNDFAKEIHINAVEHGWWDEECSVGEILALCHSEVSEALEEYRGARPNLYALDYAGDDAGCPRFIFDPDEFEGRKPEGIATELADVVIRCFDWFGRMGIDAAGLITEAKGGERWLSDFPLYRVNTFGDLIAALHMCLALAYRCYCNAAGVHATALRMAVCCNLIFEWAQCHGVDMEEIMRIKHEYNKTRPYKHGKVM